MDALLVQSIASLPTALAALVAIGLPMLLAMGVGMVILSVFTPQELALNADVGRAKFSFIVEIYAVVAALALVGAWDIYQTTRDTLQKETSALYMLAHATDNYALPHQADAREDMRGALTAYIQSELGNKAHLLEKCVPDYPVWGKRLIVDNNWYRTLARDNVDLVTTGIRRITAGPIEERRFSAWQMCASVLSPTDEAIIRTLAGSGKFDPSTLTPEAALRLLKAVARLQSPRA
jgi:hypothetical protein